MNFKCKSPCKNCPYRKDAPLQHWSVDEFIDLLKNESDYYGNIYGCHKKNGNICTGWLMHQDDNHFPSISLRLLLLKTKIDRIFLDSLICNAKRYASVEEMCIANYPELKNVIEAR